MRRSSTYRVTGRDALKSFVLLNPSPSNIYESTTTLGYRILLLLDSLSVVQTCHGTGQHLPHSADPPLIRLIAQKACPARPLKTSDLVPEILYQIRSFSFASLPATMVVSRKRTRSALVIPNLAGKAWGRQRIACQIPNCRKQYSRRSFVQKTDLRWALSPFVGLKALFAFNAFLNFALTSSCCAGRPCVLISLHRIYISGWIFAPRFITVPSDEEQSKPTIAESCHHNAVTRHGNGLIFPTPEDARGIRT
jgi:hypothetical protein